ncbi:MAG: diadenylate cyclase CdaA [Planctomycetota bacterium]|nr:diadenylate cyclase CdaA [Planctomycetota bacterium]
MPEFTLENALQVLILVAGVYLVLSLLRISRGSGLVRGLGVALLVVGVGLYSLARAWGLHELEQIMDAIFGVVIMVLVVIFQPELRRGILRLGEQGLLSRFMKSDSTETVGEVASAVARMAKRKQGALIVIEGQTALDALIDKGVRLDAAASALLLESIFQDKGSLHDGAVIIRGERIVAAGAILPLSEDEGLSKTTGTRHRAALGMAEESDALTVVVSEETGGISVAHEGSMLSRISTNAIRDVLQERLGINPDKPTTKQPIGSILRSLFTAHWAQKLISIGLGLALFLAAHERVTEIAEFTLDVHTADPNQALGVPITNQLWIRPPASETAGGTELRIVSPNAQEKLRITVRGPRIQIQELGNGIGGILQLTPDTATNRILDADEFLWGAGRIIKGLEVEWDGAAPTLAFESYVHRTMTPLPAQVSLTRGELPAHLKFSDEVRFLPNQFQLLGPMERIQELEATGKNWLEFAPLEVGDSTGGTWTGPLLLSQALRDEGFEIKGSLYAEVDLSPHLKLLGEITKDLVLVTFDPGQPNPLSRFQRPDSRVRLEIWVPPLMENPTEEERTSLSIYLRDYVNKHSRVYVDVDQPRPDGSMLANIEVKVLGGQDWLEKLPKALKDRVSPEVANRNDIPFQVVLHAEDTTLRLRPLDPGESSENDTGGNSPQD